MLLFADWFLSYRTLIVLYFKRRKKNEKKMSASVLLLFQSATFIIMLLLNVVFLWSAIAVEVCQTQLFTLPFACWQCFKLFFHLSRLIGTCHRCRICCALKMRFSHYFIHFCWLVGICVWLCHSDNNGNISNLFYCYYSIDLQFAYTSFAHLFVRFVRLI